MQTTNAANVKKLVERIHTQFVKNPMALESHEIEIHNPSKSVKLQVCFEMLNASKLNFQLLIEHTPHIETILELQELRFLNDEPPYQIIYEFPISFPIKENAMGNSKHLTRCINYWLNIEPCECGKYFIRDGGDTCLHCELFKAAPQDSPSRHGSLPHLQSRYSQEKSHQY